jgi:hypothetical protein
MHLVLESHKSDQLQQIFHVGVANLETEFRRQFSQSKNCGGALLGRMDVKEEE